ncbi:MAG: HAD hydrolase-like protein [Verrucomicrobiota bacterium]|nr:HAD hydrolase-like protein [Verrucomicrobiota bacterium]
MIRNIIFDWSGTLVDDLRAVWASTNFTIEKSGHPKISLDQFRAEFSLPYDSFYQRVTPGVSMDLLEKWYMESYRVEQKRVRPLPYACEFLNYCKVHKLKTLLLSTIHPDHYKVQSEAIKLDFDIEYVRVMDKRGKILSILEENQLSAKETIFIGDMQHDVETAKLGGIGSCAVLTGYNKREQLEEVMPDFIAENLEHLKTVLDANNLRWPPASLSYE